ncbi:hypothetical protein BZG36_00788 [Bifiguratus adelaidae]|uniref:Threonine/serine exporter-like N-terminal domain-containing protein n=1 Tax=Bifiguratus adelaidae TaxID=1938954 RepID=A0A261Y6G8_9FUNG|nr:hypothetical protein BZG36_00788 [Bifiguratus adelaidae]
MAYQYFVNHTSTESPPLITTSHPLEHHDGLLSQTILRSPPTFNLHHITSHEDGKDGQKEHLTLEIEDQATPLPKLAMSTSSSSSSALRGAGVLSQLLRLKFIETLRKDRQRQRLRAKKRRRERLYGPKLPQSRRPSTESEDDKDSPTSSDAQFSEDAKVIAQALNNMLEKQDFLVKLGKGLVRYGAPAHRIEDALVHSSRTLNVDGSYAYIPGLMLISFGDPETHTSETHLLRLSAGFDMDKLAKVDRVACDVAKMRITVSQGMMQLDKVFMSPPTWGALPILASFGVVSALFCLIFFNGTLIAGVVCGFLGLVVGILSLLAQRNPMFGNVYEIECASIIAIIIRSLHHYVTFSTTALGAIVMLLPGYTLTCAIMELSSHNILSGTIRMAYSLMVSLFLGHGLEIGSQTWEAFHPDTTEQATGMTISPLLYIPLFPWIVISLSVDSLLRLYYPV